LKLDQTDFEGRPLKVQIAVEKPKKVMIINPRKFRKAKSLPRNPRNLNANQRKSMQSRKVRKRQLRPLKLQQHLHQLKMSKELQKMRKKRHQSRSRRIVLENQESAMVNLNQGSNQNIRIQFCSLGISPNL
jgi:urease beta subunit